MPKTRLHLQTGPMQFTVNWALGVTVLRLLLLPLFLWLILMGAQSDFGVRWSAVGVLLLMALTDALDGCLARRLNQATRLGRLLDPLADKLLVGCSLVVLSFPWIEPARFAVPGPVIFGVYSKDLAVVMGATILLMATGRVEIAPRPLGKISTMLQLVLVLATLVAVDLQSLSPRLAVDLLRGLWAAVLLTAAAASADYTMQGSRQYAAFRRRNPPAGRPAVEPVA
jgi:CDP-diacylglycerol--glycerol-3-phosphate 3-phosphatidyltransferase